MSGKYAPQVVFADWIQCVALSISNSVQIFHDDLWKQREEQYLATMNRYGKEERMKMAEMAGMLILTYEKGLGDVLGEVYMESIGGNKNSGQFFHAVQCQFDDCKTDIAGCHRRKQEAFVR